jgi:hypothetical protein
MWRDFCGQDTINKIDAHKIHIITPLSSVRFLYDSNNTKDMKNKHLLSFSFLSRDHQSSKHLVLGTKTYRNYSKIGFSL